MTGKFDTGNTLSYSAEKIMQLSNEELYRVLEGLAADTERALATHRCTLESYHMLSESLSELCRALVKVMQTKIGKNLMPLLDRYRDLEGRVKEMRNDLSARSRH